MAPETACASATCTHDHGHAEEHDDAVSDAGSAEGAEGLNRGEKKARKAFAKLGLVPVEGVERVAMKRGRIVFAIARPTVFRVGNTDTYVVFGEVKGEDTAAAMAAQRLAALRAMQAGGESAAAAGAAEAHAEDAEESDGKEAADEDAPGVDEKDIIIVMEQTSASRAAALRALKENNNDIVSAIMALSS